jgi:hypothetical protein
MSPNVSQRILRNGILICELHEGRGASFRDTPLTPDTTYVYEAINVDDMGHQSLPGRRTVRTDPAAPRDDVGAPAVEPGAEKADVPAKDSGK